jgi:hypothetical protein
MDPWIDALVLRSMLDEGIELSDKQSVMTHRALLPAMSKEWPGHPKLRGAVEALERLLEPELGAVPNVSASIALLSY